MAPPPTPFHILRAHSTALSCLAFSENNSHLLAGDQDGTVSVTDLGARRVLASWHAHEGGVLGVGEWARGLVSQGRDNKVLFHAPVTGSATGAAASGSGSGSSNAPAVLGTMPCNSLNFCHFSLAHFGTTQTLPAAPAGSVKGKGKATEVEGLLALPNLTDSEFIDIYHVPSLARVHAAINFAPKSKAIEAPRAGLVMALHIAVLPDRIALVAAYEDGRAEVWSCSLEHVGTPWDGRKATSGDDKPWTLLWCGKAHNEAVMAMAVDPSFERAFTVSADHLLCRIDLVSVLTGTTTTNPISSYSTKQVGNSALAISSDGKVVAVGGWDGRIRLFSAATFKPLGTLAYHRESVQALVFGNRESGLLGASGGGRGVDDDEASVLEIGDDESDSDDDVDADVGPREGWLTSAGKDRRIALWSLHFGA